MLLKRQMFALLGFAYNHVGETYRTVRRYLHPLARMRRRGPGHCPQLDAAICAAHAGGGRSKSLNGQTGQLFGRRLPTWQPVTDRVEGPGPRTPARRPAAAAGLCVSQPGSTATQDAGQPRWALMQPSRDRRPSRLGRPPRRRTDLVEGAAAWPPTAIGLLVLLLAIWGGDGVYTDARHQSRLEHGQRTQVEAVLLDDPPPGYREADSQDVAWRLVRFAGTSGGEQVANVPAAGRQPAGGTVRLWVDRNERVMPAPLTQTDAVVISATAGIGTAAWARQSSPRCGSVCGGYSTYATARPGVKSGPRLSPSGAAETTGRER